MTTFAEKLKHLRETQKLTKYRLSKLSGIPVAYLSQLEGGKITNPRADTLNALAKGLNLEPSVFFEGAPCTLPGSPHRKPEDALADLAVTIQCFIPVYAEVSAGEGIEPIDYVACTRIKAAPESQRAYRVKGLCLEDKIHDGDTVIVDTALSPQNNDLVVVIIDDQASIKRYKEDDKGKKWLENNTGRFQPQDVYLHGVVVEVNHKLR